ncbi:MAG TPA: sialidase [Algoriphagus sp.]|nr:sialidase [Algoriphagus sp.]MAN85862.1 sialidase [Algoriphagus sp.]HAD51761.1 sialidase [Algoriphagus sp.]HAS60717.1 sialidase [Algoriphagus sp.]HCB47027.1 sialidase [Algoriphagus sp.]
MTISINCQSQDLPKSSIQYQPKYVPLPQGAFVSVGVISWEGKLPSEKLFLSLEIHASTAIDSIKIISKIAENQTETLLKAGEILGQQTLEVQSNKLSEISRANVYIKLKATHDIRDRVSIELKTLKTDNLTLPIKITRDLPDFRVANPLRNHGDDGVHSYRIPGLVTTPKGTLLAVYDIRRNSSVDLQGDIDVGLSRSNDGGRSWAPMEVIMDMGEYGNLPEDQNGIGDPAILVDHETGDIWVAALWLHGKPGKMAWHSSQPGIYPEQTGQLVLVKSEDDGVTWTEPIVITEQIKDPEWHLFFNGPGKGITMKNGTLVFPAQFKDKDQIPHSTIIFSHDKGRTWKVGTGAKSNTTEAQVVELKDGRLMLNMRDNRGGSRSIAVTNDLGKTWIEHPTSRSALIEPVCMASLIQNPKQSGMLLFSNPATTEERSMMTIKGSLDDGMTWPENLQVLLDEGKGWGYSCLTFINEKEVGILYESSVSNITFQVVPISEIIPLK